jgi:protein SCO1/2
MKNVLNLKFRNGVGRLLQIICLSVACLSVICARQLCAQTVSDDDLKKVNFEQKTGAQISMDLPFRDATGKNIRLGDCFHGKPAILILGYYHCPMLCSFVLNGMIGSLQDIQWKVGDQFEVIDVSIDPHEGPELAAAKKANYVKRYGRADSADGWHFLTGDEPAIRKLASEVGYGYVYDPKSNEYAHPSGLVILTPQGKVAHYFFGVVFSTPELKQTLLDASAKKVSPTFAQFILLCWARCGSWAWRFWRDWPRSSPCSSGANAPRQTTILRRRPNRCRCHLF